MLNLKNNNINGKFIKRSLMAGYSLIKRVKIKKRYYAKLNVHASSKRNIELQKLARNPLIVPSYEKEAKASIVKLVKGGCLLTACIVKLAGLVGTTAASASFYKEGMWTLLTQTKDEHSAQNKAIKTAGSMLISLTGNALLSERSLVVVIKMVRWAPLVVTTLVSGLNPLTRGLSLLGETSKLLGYMKKRNIVKPLEWTSKGGGTGGALGEIDEISREGKLIILKNSNGERYGFEQDQIIDLHTRLNDLASKGLRLTREQYEELLSHLGRPIKASRLRGRFLEDYAEMAEMTKLSSKHKISDLYSTEIPKWQASGGRTGINENYLNVDQYISMVSEPVSTSSSIKWVVLGIGVLVGSIILGRTIAHSVNADSKVSRVLDWSYEGLVLVKEVTLGMLSLLGGGLWLGLSIGKEYVKSKITGKPMEMPGEENEVK